MNDKTIDLILAWLKKANNDLKNQTGELGSRFFVYLELDNN
jgi:hypothetical protein